MSPVRSRPILFSAPMVRALLDDRKTQTRRIVKPQPTDYRVETVAPQRLRGDPPKHERPYFDAYSGGPHWCWWDEYDRQGADWIKCPYGVPGDLLYVRETWAADGTGGARYYATDDVHELRRKRVSIHMPRWASRLTLEIIDVRCERLQDISEADSKAEGLQVMGQGFMPSYRGADDLPWRPEFPRDAYSDLWEQINGPGSWAANPWVWCVAFRVHRANVDQVLAGAGGGT